MHNARRRGAGLARAPQQRHECAGDAQNAFEIRVDLGVEFGERRRVGRRPPLAAQTRYETTCDLTPGRYAVLSHAMGPWRALTLVVRPPAARR